MTQKYKVGDLVCYSTGYYINGNGINAYAKLLNINLNNESLSEINLVTGEGGRNTRCDIHLRIVGLSYDWWRDFKNEIKLDSIDDIRVGSEIWITKDRVGICALQLIDLKEFEECYNSMLDRMNRKLEFFKKHENIDNKLERLGV